MSASFSGRSLIFLPDDLARARQIVQAFHDALLADAPSAPDGLARADMAWMAHELRRQVIEQPHDAAMLLSLAGVLRAWIESAADDLYIASYRGMFWSAAERLSMLICAPETSLAPPATAQWLQQAGMALLQSVATTPPADARKAAVTCPLHARLITVNLAGRFPQAVTCPGMAPAPSDDGPHALIVNRSEEGALTVEQV